MPHVDGRGADAVGGTVRWSPVKSLWIGSATLCTVLLAPVLVSPGAVVLFLVTSAMTLCFGHSVGMHRRLIHRSFGCPIWLEYLCVYLGTLVGMCGPIGMIRTHDLRDWAQRQPRCHPWFRHGARWWRDGWWQLHCEVQLNDPPELRLEPEVATSRFYAWLERTWMWQQAPWAILFFLIGGIEWVVWGICARVSVCVTGHWLVGHVAHNRGSQRWVVEGAAAQGYNLPLVALVTMGESWHNNHHAYPGSARLGLAPGEMDPGWWLIRAFRRCRLAWNVVTPSDLPPRPELRSLAPATRHGAGATA